MKKIFIIAIDEMNGILFLDIIKSDVKSHFTKKYYFLFSFLV